MVVERLIALAATTTAVILTGCSVPVAPSPSTTTAAPPPTPSATTTRQFEGIDTGSGTLYVADGIGSADRQSWTTRLRWVAGILAKTDLGALDDAWDSRIDVELLTDPVRYRELAGTDAAASAAVTRCGEDQLRVTVNPRILSARPEYLDSLLLHEGVHVATRSPCDGTGPLWVKEGLAEWVASQHSPSTRASNLAWVKEALRTGEPAAALPADTDFAGADQQASYALASYAVRAAVDGGGSAWAMAYFQRVLAGDEDPVGTAKVLRWYREELGRISA